MVTAECANAAGNLVFLERFSGDLSSWTTAGPASIVTQGYNAKARLDDSPTNTAATVMTILDASNTVLITITTGNTANQLDFSTNSSTASSVSFNSSTYRQVALYVNGSTASAWLSESDGTNGVLAAVGSGKSFIGTPAKIKFAKGATTMTRTFTPPASGKWLLEYDINYSATYTYLDEVKIFEPDIFLIGDSRTDGKYPWSNHPGWSDRSASTNDETSPPNVQLGAQRGNDWPANRGFGNARLSQIVSNITSTVINQGAKRVVVSAGHNDIYTGDTLANMQGYITSIVESLEAAGITGRNIILCDSVISYLINTGAEIALLSDWNAWLEGYAATHDYAFINTRSLLESPPGTIASAYDQGDQIHYNKAGSGIYAGLIQTALDPHLYGRSMQSTAGQLIASTGYLRRYSNGQWQPISFKHLDGSNVILKERSQW